MRITIVEDNKALANGIAHQLRDKGHAVNLLYDGQSALDFLQQEDSDIMILDINLPGIDGFNILKNLRKSGNMVPVLLLTARGEIQDRVKGLNVGADDYLVKPFDMEESEARLRALIRRKPEIDDAKQHFGNLVFDRTGRKLFCNDQELFLPRKELALFECFFDRQNQIVSKSQIADYIYGVGSDIDERAVESHVSRLRKKLVSFGVAIKVARGLGYMMHLQK